MTAAERFRVESEVERTGAYVSSTGTEAATGAAVLIRDVLSDDATAEAILALAEAAMTVEDRRVVPVLAVDRDAKRIVTAVPEGDTLTAVIARGGVPLARVVPFMLEVLGALGAIHAAGLVHGRVSPDTVHMTPAGGASVSGLGIWDAEKACEPGSVAWMSPEQVQGLELSPASDLFSAGALLHRLLGGAAPFEAPTAEEAARRVLEEQPAPVDALAGPALAAVAARALAKDPGARHAHAEEFARDLLLAPLPQPEAPKPPKVPLGVRASSGMKRLMGGRGKVVVALVTIALLVGGVAFGATSYQRRQQAAQRARAEYEARTIAYLRNDVQTVRKDFEQALGNLRQRATRNRSDVTSWQNSWRSRQDSYRRRMDEVRAHNAAETAARAASKQTYTTYDFWGWPTTYETYTYTPDYWREPSVPQKPDPVRTNVSREQAGLQAAAARAKQLREEARTRLAGVSFFSPAGNSLLAVLDSIVSQAETDTALASAILTRGEAGDMIDQSKAGRLVSGAEAQTVQALDGEFAGLCRKYGLDAAAYPLDKPVDAVARAKTVGATSTLKGFGSDIRKLADHNAASFWAEGAAGAGVGESLRIEFAEETGLMRATVFPGAISKGDKKAWAATARPKVLKFAFSNGKTATFSLADTPTLQTFVFKDIPRAKWAKVTIAEAYPSSAGGGDTVISELHLYGYK